MAGRVTGRAGQYLSCRYKATFPEGPAAAPWSIWQERTIKQQKVKGYERRKKKEQETVNYLRGKEWARGHQQ